jgi:hypothetical protein
MATREVTEKSVGDAANAAIETAKESGREQGEEMTATLHRTQDQPTKVD